MMCRLRTQSFMTLGQTVRPVRVRTDRRTNFVSNIDFKHCTYHEMILKEELFICKAQCWRSDGRTRDVAQQASLEQTSFYHHLPIIDLETSLSKLCM